ncbi:uncharacterized protein E0L32_003736 [Thyridium curvatum]|uniref:Uncharacterized protein n=1 Tax=Thyridium curvatum TaxID=1093900 RepID=A0A507B2D4_9PEZI|nr:uncharacterized protein E0L32_003736 [Thyridium curvatum]TPX16442.1 hypothetical protein E0L32_003736 [Thyridium curvatum]
MCFSEFIGYTCGHASLPVLRPCPLTTERHSNPACSLHAQRPFLADEMCGPCQRLLHSRAVLIEEAEHRFMHERAVCGCEVVFPELIRPRAIGPPASPPDDEDEDDDGDALQGESGIGDGDGGSSAEKENGVGGLGAPRGMAAVAGTAMFVPAARGATTSEIPPLYQETNTGHRREVHVRLPSLYGAEWLSDHRKEHEAGRCGCKAVFATYPEVKKEVMPAATDDDDDHGDDHDDDASNAKKARHPTKKGKKISYSVPARSPAEMAAGAKAEASSDTLSLRQPRPKRPDGLNPAGLASHVRGLSFHDFQLSQWSSDSSTGSPQMTTPAPSSEPKRARARFVVEERRLPTPLPDMPEPRPAEEKKAARPKVAARIAGAVYQVPPAFAGRVGAFLTTASSSFDQRGDHTGLVLDAQTSVYPSQNLQLAGLPIGAGPEGLAPHVGDWENCALNRHLESN